PRWTTHRDWLSDKEPSPRGLAPMLGMRQWGFWCRAGREFFFNSSAPSPHTRAGLGVARCGPDAARSSFRHMRGNIVWKWHLHGCHQATEGTMMTEWRAEGARPLEFVWAALYSVLVLLLMLAWASVPA